MTVFKHRAPLLSGLLTLTLLGSGSAMADAPYPSQAITFVVPYAAGGSSDTRSRMLAQKMSDSLGVTIVVENKPGASGNIGTSMIARAKPNGYTIGLGNFGPMSVNKALYGSNLPFDPEQDLQPIALIERGAMALGVNSSSPYQSLADLVADGKQNPNKLDYASTGAGGASHLLTEQFKATSGFDAVHVPYRGGAPASNDLLAGNISFYLELASLFLPHMQIDNPRLRVLGVTSQERLKAMPDTPTFKEQGVDLVASNWFGVIAPAGLPADVLEKLNTAVNDALKDPDYRQIVESQGAQVVGGTPEEFTAFVKEETKRWTALIKDQNISIQ
ncbi:Bug family tripartite tricarboxylate transporter substrate binding protein [Alcaligenes aquatilis]|uniref:ABC transporter substrate-binding protein n=2 Tax=Alcaligenes TaxID=507 RepID=A0AB33CPA1_ALCFA|nr:MULTISPECIES: tripartite tricarboxylate transporter substrate binding protein [Alcaligenes]ASR88395.1 ABC transporter substrate-binding protein [Alcaligenes faecalis]AWG35882.1 ABC transporter substrate-binding protein [Alcaligenes aquatilis]MCC9163566.1 tripartite tricarboxylate transporter substrate binding protein [Alcaligenes sp. MMA]QXR36400.1 tripartite tricarboxylate transporter substrate binding protein [Alcaligenes aquatilis]UQN36490.1 tripartite tricarboxylate transporter substrat